MRFSLRTLVIAVAAIGLLATAVFQTWENQKLRVRLAEANAKLGILTVSDTTKIHVLQIKNLEDKWWRWKVYLPAGRFKIAFETNDIPVGGFPSESGGCGVESEGGEYVLDLKLRKDAKDRWSMEMAITKPRGASSISSTIADVDVLFRSAAITNTVDGDYSAEHPVELLRMQNRKSEIENGLLLWIEPLKE